MWKEFKEFALKGNIMDLAVGVIIGGAFQKIVNSLVNDIIMPTVAIFTGKVDYTELSVTIGGSAIKYGSFITAVVNFLIIALSIFLMIKYINKLNKRLEKIKEEELKKLEKKGKFRRRKTGGTICDFIQSADFYCMVFRAGKISGIVSDK